MIQVARACKAKIHVSSGTIGLGPKPCSTVDDEGRPTFSFIS